MRSMHEVALTQAGRRRAGWQRCVVGLAMWACTSAAHGAGMTLAQWRLQVAQVWMLADNDAVAAHARAAALQALPAGATAADQVSGLNLLALTELYLARTGQAVLHAGRALAIAARHHHRLGQAQADLVLASSTASQGRVVPIRDLLEHAMRMLDGLPQPVLQAEAMLRMAMLYSRLGQFEESVRICVQSMQNAVTAGHPGALAHAHHCMAISVGLSGNMGAALPHYQAMAVAARQFGSRLLLAEAITGQGGEIALRDNYRRGEPFLHDALQLYNEVGAPFFILFALNTLAHNQSLQGHHAEALRLHDEVVAGFERYPNPIGSWWALMGRASDQLNSVTLPRRASIASAPIRSPPASPMTAM